MLPMEKIKCDLRYINCISPWILFFSELAILGTSIYFHSIYGIGCAVIGMMLCLLRFWIMKQTRQDDNTQKKQCKLSGLGLILPALGLSAISAYQLLYHSDHKMPFIGMCILCVLISLQALVLVLAFICSRKDHTVAAHVLKHCDVSLLSVLLSLLVSILLFGGETDEWASMVCLTGCMLGGFILLIACNMILCAFCGYRTTTRSIQFLKEMYRKRRRYFYYASLGKDVVMVLAKIVLSIVSASFFMFANALFSCGIGLARYTALKMQNKPMKEQLELFRKVSVILSFAGLWYAGYSVRLFFGGTPGDYTMVMALIIALYTFVEFGIQIVDLRKLRKQHDIEAEALRLIGLSSILISFVLTQTAIMSISESSDHTFSDGLSGVVFGGLVVLVGIASQFRYWHYKKIYKGDLLENEQIPDDNRR